MFKSEECTALRRNQILSSHANFKSIEYKWAGIAHGFLNLICGLNYGTGKQIIIKLYYASLFLVSL